MSCTPSRSIVEYRMSSLYHYKMQKLGRVIPLVGPHFLPIHWQLHVHYTCGINISTVLSSSVQYGEMLLVFFQEHSKRETSVDPILWVSLTISLLTLCQTFKSCHTHTHTKQEIFRWIWNIMQWCWVIYSYSGAIKKWNICRPKNTSEYRSYMYM